jgi:hypothetical protein
MSSRPINSTCSEFNHVSEQIKELEKKREELRQEIIAHGSTMTRDWILIVESCHRAIVQLEALKRLFRDTELKEKGLVKDVSFKKVKLSPRKGYKE